MSALSNASPGRLSGSLTPVRNEYSKALVAAGAGRGRFFDHEPETSEADLSSRSRHETARIMRWNFA